MSEIPFVNKLGDAIDAAIATPRPARRRLPRRRFGVLALAVLLLGASGVTVARMASDGETLATGSVACYENADLSGDIAVLDADGRSPVEVCTDAWSAEDGPVPAMLACVHGGVAVIPARGLRSCADAGFEELPRGYAPAQAKVARLARDIGRLEAAADCIPRRALARRAQALLRRTGWQGWRTVLRGGDGGPCGHILMRGGTPDLKVTSALFPDAAQLTVRGGPPRSLDRLLFGEQSLGVALMDASGERCYTLPELRRKARRVLAPTGVPLTFNVGRMPPDTGMAPPRGDRYAQGCAIAVGAHAVYPRPGAVGVEAELWLKRP
jgi:hypothetical protein